MPPRSGVPRRAATEWAALRRLSERNDAAGVRPLTGLQKWYQPIKAITKSKGAKQYRVLLFQEKSFWKSVPPREVGPIFCPKSNSVKSKSIARNRWQQASVALQQLYSVDHQILPIQSRIAPLTVLTGQVFWWIMKVLPIKRYFHTLDAVDRKRVFFRHYRKQKL